MWPFLKMETNMELDLTKIAIDVGVGYYYVYQPDHPMANAAGKVYIHRYVAETFYGVRLTSDLHVHHKDENKLNNDPDNLEILTAAEHGKLHSPGNLYDLNCKYCDKLFTTSEHVSAIFCSDLCRSSGSRKFEITKDELQELVNMMPITEIAKLFGVSDVAIHKRCRMLEVTKMPKGYFLRK